MDEQFYPQQQQYNYQDQYVNQPVTTDEIYAKDMQQEIARNIVAQINPDQQLFEIEMKLRGFKKNYMTSQWDKRTNVIELNEDLIDDFMAYLSSIMNQSTSMSNLSDNEINKIMNQAIEWVSDALEIEKYGVLEYNDRTRIGHIILNPMFIVMKRALFGQESRRMWKSINLNESGSPEAQQKKPSMLDAFKFWK